MAANSYSSQDCLCYLSREVSKGLVVFVYIEVISINVVAAVPTTASSSSTRSIKENLLANDALRVALVTVGALANASIVQENEWALALETASCLRGRALLASWIASDTFLIISCVTTGTLRKAFGS